MCFVFERAMAPMNFLFGWGNCKFLLEHSKGTNGQWPGGMEVIALVASLKYQACFLIMETSFLILNFFLNISLIIRQTQADASFLKGQGHHLREILLGKGTCKGHPMSISRAPRQWPGGMDPIAFVAFKKCQSCKRKMCSADARTLKKKTHQAMQL